MASCRSPISLYGAPSTTFLHIKRVLERVIQRAHLPLEIHEVKELNEILAANIHTVPTLKIHSKSYSFSKEGTTNYVLKQAIVDLLQHYDYGEWPCVAVPFKKPEKVIPTLLYAHQLVNQNDSCLELQSLSTECSETSLAAEKKLQNYIAAGSEEAMGQILSRPIIAQAKYSSSLWDHIIHIEQENNYRAIIVSQEDWAQEKSNWDQVYSQLRHPLLLIPDRVEFHRSVNAHWLIHEPSLGTAAVQSILQLSHWFDLNIMIYSKQSIKQLLEQCPELSVLKSAKISLQFSPVGAIPRSIHASDLLFINTSMDSSELHSEYYHSDQSSPLPFVTIFLPQNDSHSAEDRIKGLNVENRKKGFVPVL